MATILIADDTMVVRKILNKLFTEAGHTIVAEAENGLKACEEYAKFLPDIVTMDVNMPVMNGFEACKRIVAEFPNAKIIVLTSLGSQESVVQAFKNGAKHYLIKPLEANKALAVINSVLYSSGGLSVDNFSNASNSQKSAQGEKKPFTVNKDGEKLVISIDLSLANSNINTFYAQLISVLRKHIFSNLKLAAFTFESNTFDDILISNIAEIIGLVFDAGIGIEIFSTESFVNYIKKFIPYNTIKYYTI